MSLSSSLILHLPAFDNKRFLDDIFGFPELQKILLKSRISCIRLLLSIAGTMNFVQPST